MENMRNISKNRILSVFLAAALAILSLVGCETKAPSDPDAFKLYFVNNSETGIVAVDYEI